MRLCVKEENEIEHSPMTFCLTFLTLSYLLMSTSKALSANNLCYSFREYKKLFLSVCIRKFDTEFFMREIVHCLFFNFSDIEGLHIYYVFIMWLKIITNVHIIQERNNNALHYNDIDYMRLLGKLVNIRER